MREDVNQYLDILDFVFGVTVLDLSAVPAETVLANAYQDHPHLRQAMTDALLQVCAALEFPEKPALFCLTAILLVCLYNTSRMG